MDEPFLSTDVCNPACLEFARTRLSEGSIRRKRVLEVGACNVNGSLRSFVEDFKPSEYVGVDIAAGPGVDDICDIGRLVDRFGVERFDTVLCTEVLEHVREWQLAISNLKNVLAAGGILLITTRSIGFHYHGYPQDFWRYQPDDFEALFADMVLEAVEVDPIAPGVFFTARKPADFAEGSLPAYELHSVIRGRRCATVSNLEILLFLQIKRPIRRIFARLARWLRKRRRR